jgi:hypothetical protein
MSSYVLFFSDEIFPPMSFSQGVFLPMSNRQFSLHFSRANTLEHNMSTEFLPMSTQLMYHEFQRQNIFHNILHERCIKSSPGSSHTIGINVHCRSNPQECCCICLCLHMHGTKDNKQLASHLDLRLFTLYFHLLQNMRTHACSTLVLSLARIISLAHSCSQYNSHSLGLLIHGVSPRSGRTG